LERAEIIWTTPGLDSNTKLSQQIETLIKNLASDDYQTREQAHKDLAALGRKAQKELQRFVSDENAEIKRHVGEILKEIEEQAEERDDDEDSTVEQPWIRPDTVVTTDFTVLGKVSPKEFKIDMLRCIFCGYCQEVCPEEAIFLMKDYSLTGLTRGEMIFDKEKLLSVFDMTKDAEPMKSSALGGTL
jgi:ferredoxin